MSTESVDSVEAARAQGFPDRTGWKPDNPYLATFRPFIPSNVVISELTASRNNRGNAARHCLRRVVTLPRVESWAHGKRVNSSGRNLNHAVPSAFKDWNSQRHNSREQHCADCRLCR